VRYKNISTIIISGATRHSDHHFRLNPIFARLNFDSRVVSIPVIYFCAGFNTDLPTSFGWSLVRPAQVTVLSRFMGTWFSVSHLFLLVPLTGVSVFPFWFRRIRGVSGFLDFTPFSRLDRRARTSWVR